MKGLGNGQFLTRLVTIRSNPTFLVFGLFSKRYEFDMYRHSFRFILNILVLEKTETRKEKILELN